VTERHSDHDEESMMWQDVLDQLAAGRTEGLACPFCHAELTVEHEQTRTRLECRRCRHFIEGRMAQP
jgi:hypothetical protein